MANIAQAKPSAIFVMRPSPRAVYFHKNDVAASASSVLLYFKLKDMLTEDIPWKLMNKQMCFFDKNLLTEPQFYNYSSIL